MLLRALKGKEKVWGMEHPFTLTTVDSLGILYADQERLAEAEKMYLRALDGRKKAKALGPKHPLTLETIHNLRDLYEKQGRIAEAE